MPTLLRGRHKKETAPVALVVSDDPDEFLPVSDALRADGIAVVEARGSDAGWARFRDIQPDIGVLDLEMAGTSGADLSRRVRRISDVPILLVSNGNDTRELDPPRGRADDRATRSANPAEILMRVRRMLEHVARHPTISSTHFNHVCTVCLSAVVDAAAKCPECDAEPPPSGWVPLDGALYPYLGKLLDDRYLLLQFIDTGGVGEVYRARMLGGPHDFACKVVDANKHAAGKQTIEVLERFHRETDLMSQLRNPHVVTIHDSIAIRPGVLALMMDFVHGRDLRALLRAVGRMNVKAALELTHQVANGLHEAHQLGVVHRDIKPANIMVERLPASGFFARILDFGIAHMVGDPEPDRSFSGTPAYACPEQWTFQREPDPRGDIYSLGCVLFECLTGRPPFTGSVTSLMRQHLHSSPPRLGDFMAEGVSQPLEDLIASMLAKSPDDRPSHLLEVIEVMDQVLSTRRYTGRTTAEFDLPVVDIPTTEERSATRSTSVRGRYPNSFVVEVAIPEEPDSGELGPVALDERGVCAVVGERGGTLHSVEIVDDAGHRRMGRVDEEVVALAVGHATGVAVACDARGQIWLWHEADATPHLVTTLPAPAVVLRLAAETGRLVFGDRNGRLGAIRLCNGDEETLGTFADITALAVTADESLILTGLRSGQLYATHSGEEPYRLTTCETEARSLLLSPDGFLGAVLQTNGRVSIFNCADGRPLFRVPFARMDLMDIAFTPDLALIGVGLEQRSLGVWKLECRPVSSPMD